ncbi:MAG TPA: PAS domain S-box protein [Microvirga sp.]|jgi:PAS domain S-box-containing protein
MHAFVPAKPPAPDADALVDALLATGRFADRDEVLRAALATLIQRPPPTEAEARLEAAIEGMGDAFYALDRNWRYTAINRAAEAYYARPRETMLGRVIWEIFPWSEGTDLRMRYEAAMASRRTDWFMGPSVGIPDRAIEVRLFPFGDGLGVSFRDWTERQRTEEALRASEQRLRLAIEAAQIAIWEFDVAAQQLMPSPELNIMLGYPPDAAPTIEEMRRGYLPGEGERLQAAGRAALERGERFFEVEYRYRRRDDRVIWLQLRAEIHLGEAGQPERVVGVLLDITERKASEAALLESETRLEIATAAAELGIWDWDVVAGTMIYSERARAIYGFTPDEPVTFAEVRARTHPDDLPSVSALSRRALDPAIRAKEPYEYRVVRPDGTERWLLAHGEAVFGVAEGVERALRYVGTLQDITERKEAETALRESEARLAALTDNLPIGMVYQMIVSPDLSQRRMTYVSKSCERVIGISAETVVADVYTLLALMDPADAERVRAREMEAIRTLTPFEIEMQARHAITGELRNYRLMSAPRRLPGGETIWDGIQIDVTEQRRAEEAVRRSQERLRTVLNEMPVGVVLARMPSGEIVFSNAKAQDLLGHPIGHPKDMSEYTGFGALHEDGTPFRAEDYPLVRTVLTGADIDQEEMLYRRGDGRLAHLSNSSSPVRGQDGEVLAVLAFTDISERKRAEEHQRLLINELNHRVKNTLATVQSLAAQSFREAEASGDGASIAGARSAFDARLFALARAHDVLTQESWEGAELAAIVGEAAAPYRGAAEFDRFAVAGPDLRVDPKTALALSMALHELATNAVKYGALSRPEGRIRIAWTACDGSAEGPGRRLHLTWEERGGPPVREPTRRGFGTRLIERGLARELGGTVALTYAPEGLACRMDVPLA